MTSEHSIYQELGDKLIGELIDEFYRRAFEDPVIGHLFWGFDRASLSQSQTVFATAMLGGPAAYKGKSLDRAHRSLKINQAHFGRRQVIMSEVLRDFGLAEELAKEWLLREERLRPLIVKGRPCNA